MKISQNNLNTSFQRSFALELKYSKYYPKENEAQAKQSTKDTILSALSLHEPKNDEAQRVAQFLKYSRLNLEQSKNAKFREYDGKLLLCTGEDALESRSIEEVWENSSSNPMIDITKQFGRIEADVNPDGSISKMSCFSTINTKSPYGNQAPLEYCSNESMMIN